MHKILLAVAVVALAVGGTACGGHYSGGGLPPASTEVYNITPGASVIIGSGGVAGYGITANTGGVYRVVWNGDQSSSGYYRHFYGSVWTPGSFQSVTPGCIGGACPIESNDYVGTPVNVAGGQRLDFDTQTSDGIDGFDITVDYEPVYFDLLIDGARYPNLVFFFSADLADTANPAFIPFGLQGT